MKTQLTQSIRLLFWLILTTLFLTTTADTYSQSTTLDIPPNLEVAYETDALIIQFAGHTKMRQVKSGSKLIPLDQNQQVSAADVSALQSISAGGEWRRGHTLSEGKLEALWQRAVANVDQGLSDPNNRYRITIPDGKDIVTVAKQLHQQPSVEAVYFVPKPAPVASTIDYSTAGNVTGNEVTDPYQGYLDAAPNGVDARWAWLGMGGRGDGMRICDVEYDYNANHADLPNITYVGAPKDPPFPPDHGTAVLGEMGGENNGIGVTGIAYQALYYFAAAKTTTGGYDVGAAVLECADALTAGDVILIEQQTAGPNATGVGQAGLVPVEWFKPWYDDIKIAVAAGMIVVEAAGNGNEDLDDAVYSTGNSGHFPFLAQNDSGAYIVGSANPPSFGVIARSRRPSSNYGATVDLQGWGTGIVTTGYGNLFPGSPTASQENEWYTSSFGGTSGASPMVAAAAAIVQRNWELTHGGIPASPAEIKQILRETGSPQAGIDNIGPFPNLRAAILQVLGNQALDVAPPTITPASGSYAMPLQAQIGYGSGQNGDNTNIRYTLDGSEPTPDSFIFIPEQGDAIYLNYGVTIKAKAFQFHAPTQRTYKSETATVTFTSTTPKVENPVISPNAGTYNQGTQLILTTNTPGAIIRYRLDGRSPSFFYPGTVYSSPVTLPAGEHAVVARAYKDGYYKSDRVDSGQIVINEIVLPTPVIYPNGGDFNGQVTVYLGSTVLGANIRYTIDGSTPSQSSPQFSEPINLTESATVKARVYLDGYTPSEVIEKTFNVTQQAQGPTIDPNGGEFTGEVEISMSAPNADATIRYTTNGAEPTSYSSVYNTPFSLGVGETTVKAKAFLAGAESSETTSAQFTVYTLLVGQAQAPTVAPDGGNHTDEITVTMRTDTEGATIRYTFDTSLTEDEWGEYTGPITLMPSENGQLLRAKAYKSDMNASNLKQTNFNIFDSDLTGQIENPDIDPPSGTYNDVVQVTVDGHTSPPFKIRQLHITTDGTEPRPSANTGSGESSPKNLTVSESSTVKALASQLGWSNSQVVTREYILVCATPVITAVDAPPDAKTITISTDTPNATIHYNTDGFNTTEYSGPFDVGIGATVINARCFRNGFEDSASATEIILVEQQVAPTITLQPQGVTVDAGVDISLTVAATGILTPAIQWQFNGIDIAGETEPVLDVPAVSAANAGEYRAIARNEAGDATSEVVTVTVNSGIAPMGLSIDTSSPTNLGNPTFFAASVEAGSEISYTWSFGDQAFEHKAFGDKGVSAAASNVGGSPKTGQSVSHTYGTQGIYTTSVTATNDFGTESFSVQVEIVEPLPTASPSAEPSGTPGTATPNPDPGETTTPASETPIPSGTPAPSETAAATPTDPAMTGTPTSGTPLPATTTPNGTATPTATDPAATTTPQSQNEENELYLPFVADG